MSRGRKESGYRKEKKGEVVDSNMSRILVLIRLFISRGEPGKLVQEEEKNVTVMSGGGKESIYKRVITRERLSAVLGA